MGLFYNRLFLAFLQSKEGLLHWWAGTSIILLMVQGGVASRFPIVLIGNAAVCHCLVRSIIICAIVLCSSNSDGGSEQRTIWRSGGNAYPNNRTVIRQQCAPQSRTIKQPGYPMMGGYNYGYGPSYGYPYYGGYGTDAALMGLVAGSMMHDHYHDYGWGGHYGGYYDEGFGGHLDDGGYGGGHFDGEFL